MKYNYHTKPTCLVTAPAAPRLPNNAARWSTSNLFAILVRQQITFNEPVMNKNSMASNHDLQHIEAQTRDKHRSGNPRRWKYEHAR